MSVNIVLYDHSNIDQYQWPNSNDGNKAREYLVPLIKGDIKNFLTNVTTKVLLITCNDVFLPLTINDTEYENSYIASNYYGIKFYEENSARKHPFLNSLQKPALVFGGLFLKLFKINKTIFLNNWLMTNSLSPKISENEMEAILDFLTKTFPHHIVIFRHIDRLMKKDLYQSLSKSRCHLLKTRDIFFYQPKVRERVSKCRQRDLKILEKYQYEVIDSQGIKESDYPRLLSLYEKVYVQKYTKYSPQYTVGFLKAIHEKNLVNFIALKRQGVIEGFFSHFVYNSGMIYSLFGYDTEVPHAHDIYKLLTRLGLEEAEKHNLLLNDGSGGDDAKLNRGMQTASEYMAVYNAHLPLPRRILWNTVALFFRLYQRKE